MGNKHTTQRKFALSALLFFILATARATVSLPGILSDGMILQRGLKIPVWGWASAGEKIQVHFRGDIFQVTCGNDGRWQTELPPCEAGGPFEMIILGSNEIRVQNILAGDVWVCSGQSNMAFRLKTVKDKYAGDIKKASGCAIRVFEVSRGAGFDVQDRLSSGRWKQATETTVSDFPAVAYFFAAELYAKYKIPVGLINASVGGTPAEAWMSLDALKQFPSCIRGYEDARMIFTEKDLEDNHKTAVKPEYSELRQVPSCLFNAMIAPLIPYSIKGVIWYQGERNAQSDNPGLYRTLFPALINDWRAHWGLGEFPFIYVQLPNYKEPSSWPEESGWAEIREAQLMALSLPNTGMAITIDLGDARNLHPHNKKEVGQRLALVAQKLAFHDESVVYSGPVYHSMRRDGNKIIISFTSIGSGLAAKGGGCLEHFSIAGDDRKFIWANAKIEGEQVVVWSDEVSSPVAVRYAWADNPESCNLYNKEGLPASPFRTDNWQTTYLSGKETDMKN
jgi:sialate O-acetylesterase